MSNITALIIAVLILAAIIGDWLMTGGAGFVFAGRQLMALLEWLAFWR